MSNIEHGNLPIYEKTISKDLSVSYYHSKGSKDITIVLIHGLGSSKEDFLSILNYNELTSYDIIFADLVGHGDSTTPKNSRIQWMTKQKSSSTYSKSFL